MTHATISVFDCDDNRAAHSTPFLSPPARTTTRTTAQLRDLAQIFSMNGMPSVVNPYLFNGDLVDRGEQSLEICLLLMGLAVADPLSVKINRGNHEVEKSAIHHHRHHRHRSRRRWTASPLAAIVAGEDDSCRWCRFVRPSFLRSRADRVLRGRERVCVRV